MKYGWRPSAAAASASVLLAGCGAEVTSSQSSGWCSAMTSTSPDWMFGLLLASGGVAMFSGFIWFSFLPGMIPSRPPPRPEPRRWYSPRNATLALIAVVFALNAFTMSTSSHEWTPADRYIVIAMLGTIVLAAGLLVVALRRYRATGVWPSGRRAPWGSFWVLPVIFVAAVGSGIWALFTMVTWMVSTAGPC